MHRAVAVLETRTRSGDEQAPAETIRVPQDARSLVLTLRPDVTVRSGTVVCLLEKTEAQLRLFSAACQTMSASRLQVELASDQLRLAPASSHRVIVAIGPSDPSSTAEAAQSFMRAPDEHPGGQRLDLHISADIE